MYEYSDVSLIRFKMSLMFSEIYQQNYRAEHQKIHVRFYFS